MYQHPNYTQQIYIESATVIIIYVCNHHMLSSHAFFHVRTIITNSTTLFAIQRQLPNSQCWYGAGEFQTTDTEHDIS